MGERTKARRELLLSHPERRAELLAAGAQLLVRAAEVADLANATHGVVAQRGEGLANIGDGRGNVYSWYQLPTIKLPGREVKLRPIDREAGLSYEDTVRCLGVMLELCYRDDDTLDAKGVLPQPYPVPNYVFAATYPVALGVERYDAPYKPGPVSSISGNDLVIYNRRIEYSRSTGLNNGNGYTEFPVWTRRGSKIEQELEDWELLPHLPAEGLPNETFEYHETNVDNMSQLLEEVALSLHDLALNPRPQA